MFVPSASFFLGWEGRVVRPTKPFRWVVRRVGSPGQAAPPGRGASDQAVPPGRPLSWAARSSRSAGTGRPVKPFRRDGAPIPNYLANIRLAVLLLPKQRFPCIRFVNKPDSTRQRNLQRQHMEGNEYRQSYAKSDPRIQSGSRKARNATAHPTPGADPCCQPLSPTPIAPATV